MSLLNFKIFRDAMSFSAAIFPNRQIVFDAGIGKNQHILMYGHVSKTLIKRTLEAIGKNGMLYVMGRSSEIINYNTFTQKKYKNNIVVNPFFESLPKNSLDLILVANASLNWENINPLALQAKVRLKSKGRIVIIDQKIPHEDLIAISKRIAWLKQVKNSKVLSFEKID